MEGVIEKVTTDGGKWCYFHGYERKTHEPFTISGKLWYLGEALENSGIDIENSPWALSDFDKVIREMVLLKTGIIWENEYPRRVATKDDRRELKIALYKLKEGLLTDEEIEARKKLGDVFIVDNRYG